MTDSPTEPESTAAGTGRNPPPSTLALVLAWCGEAPARMGELIVPPPGAPGPWRVFGRGKARPEDSHPRVELLRERPGDQERTDPLASSRLSREQLLLRSHTEASIELRNVGRAKLRHNGSEATTALVSPGDTVQVGSQLLFLCAQRFAWIPRVHDGVKIQPFGEPDEHGIAGESSVAWELRRQIAFVSALSGHVLITGASGTGKELVARAIHARSSRGRRSLVSRNAATFPETLVDAELFGNAKGYPNPGMAERPGLVGQAAESTLFLDEIGELPEGAQAHLLRLLDSGEYQRLGDARVLKADVRVIAATNNPQRLRSDFGPRFSLRIVVPDLNSRREDIPIIARSLARRLAREHPNAWRRFAGNEGLPEIQFSPGFMRAMSVHTYGSNVRELEALLWASVQHSQGERLECPPQLCSSGTIGLEASATEVSDGGTSAIDPKTLDPSQIKQCLDAHGGSIELSWRALGLASRHVLVRLIKKHGLR